MVLLVLVLACVGIYFAVSKLVLHPLDALGRAAKQIGAGDFSYQLEARTVGGPDELTEFADDFDKMARQLERLYTDLESEVRSQTDKLSALNDLLLYQKVELKKALDRLSEETAYKRVLRHLSTSCARRSRPSSRSRASCAGSTRSTPRRAAPWRRSRRTPRCCSTW